MNTLSIDVLRLAEAMRAFADAASNAAKAFEELGQSVPTTNIQKVEIVVTSNDEPSRIARQVVEDLQNISRRPRKK